MLNPETARADVERMIIQLPFQTENISIQDGLNALRFLGEKVGSPRVNELQGKLAEIFPQSTVFRSEIQQEELRTDISLQLAKEDDNVE